MLAVELHTDSHSQETHKNPSSCEEEYGESLDLTHAGVGGITQLRGICLDDAEEPVSASDLRPKQGKYSI